MSTPYVVRTLGCKANFADGQALDLKLRTDGFAPAKSGEIPGLVVINSCSVTDEADKQSRKLARKLKKQYPGAKVVFTGCAAEVDPELMAKTPGVDAVIGNQDKARFVDLVRGLTQGAPQLPAQTAAQGEILGNVTSYKEMASRHPMDRDWPLVDTSFAHALIEDGDAARTRAFLKIQDGCNAFCTYCVIPYGRGPARSLAMDVVLSEISRLVDGGLREVVLTGINLGDYGVDWEGTYELPSLISRILGETKLERLRVSSLDPTEVTPEILKLMEQSPRFMPHFHVSLQSPSSKILKLMKRKYGFAEVEATLNAIACLKTSWGVVPFVGMDVITGFPGETDQDADESYQALKSLPWSRLHVFPYSERKGTPATRLPNAVPPVVRAARAARLRGLSLERLQAQYDAKAMALKAESGRLKGVLLESGVRGPDGAQGWISGYTPDYRRVLVKSSNLKSNSIIEVAVSGTWVDRNSGEVTYLTTCVSAC